MRHLEPGMCLFLAGVRLTGRGVRLLGFHFQIWAVCSFLGDVRFFITSVRLLGSGMRLFDPTECFSCIFLPFSLYFLLLSYAFFCCFLCFLLLFSRLLDLCSLLALSCLKVTLQSSSRGGLGLLPWLALLWKQRVSSNLWSLSLPRLPKSLFSVPWLRGGGIPLICST